MIVYSKDRADNYHAQDWTFNPALAGTFDDIRESLYDQPVRIVVNAYYKEGADLAEKSDMCVIRVSERQSTSSIVAVFLWIR